MAWRRRGGGRSARRIGARVSSGSADFSSMPNRDTGCVQQNAAQSHSRNQHLHSFVFEPLEPRLLLSADLSPAAGLAIVGGLQHLDQVIQNLALTPDGGATAPIVNRTLADLAALGDPIAHLQAASSTYLANTPSATIQGLASALNQMPEAHGSATAAVNGALDTVSIQLADNINPAALVFDLSGSVGGLNLAIDPGHAADLTGNRAITLTFGIDTSSGTFFITSGEFTAGIHVAADQLQTGLNFGGIATTVTNGTASLDANLDVHLVDPANPSGQSSITDHELTSTSATQLLQTNLTGQASLALDLAGASLPNPEHVDIAWRAPFAPTLANVTYQPNSPLEQLVNAQISASLAQNGDPLLYTEVASALNNFQTVLNDIQSVLTGASLLGGSLPFVGKNLGSESIFTPLSAQINSLQNKLTNDLTDQNNTSVLSTVQSDIGAILTTAGLLPDGASNDVQLYYQTQDNATHTFHGEAISLTTITSLELDLVIGQTWLSQNKIGFDFGLPGLGLSVNNSTIDGHIDWRLDVGVGMTTAGSTYIVFSPDQKNTNNSPLGLNVSYTLSQNFTALGKMGFLEAVLKEKPTDASHPATGISGGIGLGLENGVGQGQALDGGVMISNLGTLVGAANFNPSLSLTAHSNLQVLFGADFQKDPQTGDYIDQSKFPSLKADFMLDESFGGLSIDQASAPIVSLSHVTLDFGQAITDFIVPVLKPFYDETKGLEPFFDFLTSPVPVVGTFASWVSANVPFGTAAIQTKLPTFDPNATYDWLHFGIDLMVDDGNIDLTTGKDIEKGAEAVFQIFHQLDSVYSAANTASQSSPSLGIDLGNFDFGGADLRLSPFKPGSAGDLANYAGKAIIDFSGLNQSDPQVQAAINGYIGKLSSVLPQGLRNELSSAVGTISDVYNTLFAAADLGGTQDSTQQTLATVDTPFFDNPASIIGLLFGQNIDFIKVDLGFSLHDHDVQTFPVLSFFHIVDLNLVLDTTLNFDVGLSFGYDTKGLVDLATHSGGNSLLDGIWLAGDPLLPGTSDVLKLAASIFVGAGADVLAGLAGVTLEGGVGLDVAARLLVPPGQSEIHYNEFIQDTDFNLNDGLIGPIKVTADGWAQLRVITEEAWGLASQTTDITPRYFIFHYPNVNPSDVYPLAFYHPSTGELDLYMGPTADQRFIQEDGSYNGPPIDPNPPASAADELLRESETYDITIDSGDIVTLSAYGAHQTFSGPVRLIIANTGGGNDTINVHNNAPNDVQVRFTGGGATGTAVPDSNNPGQSTSIGGNDIFNAGGGNAILVGGSGNDLLTGGLANDLIQGNDGNDTVFASGGRDTIDGGTGINLIDFSQMGAPVTVNLAAGTATGGTIIADTLSRLQNITGTPFSDVLTGDNNANVIRGLGGNDQINGLGGNDQIFLGDGNNTVFAGDGNDTVLAGAGHNSIDGGTGDDSIVGGTGTSTLLGGDGNDIIIGNSGADHIDGGTGNDIITAATGTGNSILGGDGNDTINGGNGHDTIDAGTGDDVVNDGQGGSLIFGGTGNDTINGGAGDDTIYGGDGNDIIYGAAGNDYIDAGIGDNFVDGGAGNDTILAGAGNDTIIGGLDNDSINAGDGANVISGGDGNDTIVSGIGNDTIDGGLGNDSISAGAGDDFDHRRRGIRLYRRRFWQRLRRWW